MTSRAIISGSVANITPSAAPSVCIFTIDIETYHPDGSRHEMIEVEAAGAIAERLQSYLKPNIHLEVDGFWKPSRGRVIASSVKPVFPRRERRA
jgi:hypothetical protein